MGIIDKQKLKKLITVAILSVSLFIVLFQFIKNFTPPSMWDFRNNLFIPVQLLIQNQSPYDIQGVVEGSNAVWPPMVLGVFFVLGFLEFEIASNIWLLLNICALFTVVWIASSRKYPPLILFAFSLFIILIFPSSVTNILLGQISILVCLFMLILLRFYRKMPSWAVGLFLSFSLFKPQLSVFFVPAFLYKLWAEKGTQAIFKVIAWAVMTTLLTFLPLQFLYPNWLPDYIGNLMKNANWAHPSILSFMTYTSGFEKGIVNLALVIVGLIISFSFIKNDHIKTKIQDNNILFKNPEEGLYWVLAITTIFSPYIWTWDFVLLYPLMVMYLFNQNSKKITLLVFGYLLIMSLFIIQKLSGEVSELNFWWVPWSILLFISSYSLVVKREKNYHE